MVSPGRDPSPWLLWATAAPAAAKLRLLCFPHAGGGAGAYLGWARQLSPDVQVGAVQLPGRETRLAEPPQDQLEVAIEGITAAVEALPVGEALVFFGHSMGAILAFETAHHLQERGVKLPARLVVSACRAPHLAEEDPPVSHLPDADFVDAVARLDGISPGVRENPELLELALPALRADFVLCERYVCRREGRLDCPITIWGGREDPKVSEQQLLPWRCHTTLETRLRLFPGGHFFIREERSGALRALSEEVACGAVP
jgi:medium-chain acyl-[acyl-carrier-protein] hydrolase